MTIEVIHGDSRDVLKTPGSREIMTARGGIRYERHADDWYKEPIEATLALLRAESFVGMRVWDPACGAGNVLCACEIEGITAVGSDIVKRSDHPLIMVGPHNFLTGDIEPKCDAVITNPPYRDIEAFVRRALMGPARKIAVLARLAFLEGQDRGANFWRHVPLARVLVFSKRLNMPPADIPPEVKRAGGTIAFAWFVFEPGHDGPACLGWI
jgi:hypothetical protein